MQKTTHNSNSKQERGSMQQRPSFPQRSKNVTRFVKQNWLGVTLGSLAVVALGVGIYSLLKSDLFNNGRLV